MHKYSAFVERRNKSRSKVNAELLLLSFLINESKQKCQSKKAHFEVWNQFFTPLSTSQLYQKI